MADTTTAEEAVVQHDAAMERFLPVANLAMTEALMAPGGVKPPVPDVVSDAVKVAVLATLIGVVAGTVKKTPPPPEMVTPDLASPSQAEIKRVADILTPEVTSEAWEWAIHYAEDMTKQAIDVSDPAEVERKAKLLARTLATRAAAESTLATGSMLKLPYKIWISRGDGRVRSSHRRLHGFPVEMSKPFKTWPTGQILDYPGDVRAPLRETAGCRCLVFLSPTKEHVAEALAPADLDKAFALAASLESRWGFDDD